MKPSSKQVGVAVAAALLAIAAYGVYDSFDRKLRNCYAVWWVADMVIEHLIANDDEWPSSWDDLRDDYQTCANRSGKPWTFEELNARVSVDFTINGKELSAACKTLSQPNFRVIWLTDGTASHWQSHEPNTMIFNYFKGISSAQPTVAGFGGSGVD